MAIVKFSGDGQEIPFLTMWLPPHRRQSQSGPDPFYPEMANAIIRRDTDASGQLVITMTKQAGTKGQRPGPGGGKSTRSWITWASSARRLTRPCGWPGSSRCCRLPVSLNLKNSSSYSQRLKQLCTRANLTKAGCTRSARRLKR
jgi:hypothetical protein